MIQKIIDHKYNIVGVRLDGMFYDVDCVMVDDAECYDVLTPDEVIMKAHQIDENECIIEFEFTVKDLKEFKEIKLYELKEIK